MRYANQKIKSELDKGDHKVTNLHGLEIRVPTWMHILHGFGDLRYSSLGGIFYRYQSLYDQCKSAVVMLQFVHCQWFRSSDLLRSFPLRYRRIPLLIVVHVIRVQLP